jgi:hypothetical protein
MEPPIAQHLRCMADNAERSHSFGGSGASTVVGLMARLESAQVTAAVMLP